jgi:hypothetical protein
MLPQFIPFNGRGHQLLYHPRYFCWIKPLPPFTKYLYFNNPIDLNISNMLIGDDTNNGENYEKNSSVYGRKNKNGVDAQ